jgi:hypothetical protein
MVSEKNKKNYAKEKKGLGALKKKYPNFITTGNANKPTPEIKIICQHLGVDPYRYYKTFDGVLLEEGIDSIDYIKSYRDFKLIELKSTEGSFKEFPKNTFFGLTQNEHDFLKIFYKTYFLCIYHTKKEICSNLIDIKEFEKLSRTKDSRSLFRTQYQVKFQPYDEELI